MVAKYRVPSESTIVDFIKGTQIHDEDFKPLRKATAAHAGVPVIVETTSFLGIPDPSNRNLVFIGRSDALRRRPKPSSVTVEQAVSVLFNQMAEIVLENIKRGEDG